MMVSNLLETPLSLGDDTKSKETAAKIENNGLKERKIEINQVVDKDDDGELEWNFCQIWGNNWRQFTSVLPGALLHYEKTTNSFSKNY